MRLTRKNTKKESKKIHFVIATRFSLSYSFLDIYVLGSLFMS